MTEIPRNPADFDWTDEAVDKLTILWDTGMPAKDIAREVGGDTLSKNAVIGKARRIYLASRKPVKRMRKIREKSEDARSAVGPTRAQRRRAASYHFKRAGEELACEPIPPMDDVPPDRRVPFAALQYNQCRFFCGTVGEPDGGFCPEKSVDGRSWCAGHSRIVFAPPRPRTAHP